MLTHIQIRNFAIVDALTLELQAGLTVLTGETGAGKSILLDALGLALGDRADSGVVRQGCERAEITVSFDIAALPEAAAWLAQRELDADGECIIRRTVSGGGGSRAYINGQPSPVQSLRELGEMLVDLHGQHEHQSLLRRDVQRQLLDDFAGHGDLAAQVARAHHRWRELREELERLRTAGAEREARLELLRFQVGELEKAAPEAGEWAALEQEHGRLANGARLLQTGERALGLLYESDEAAVAALLSRVGADLEDLTELDASLNGVVEMLASATIQVKEAAGDLRHYLDGLELDPERLALVEERISTLHELARKHHIAPDSLAALLPELSTELEALESADSRSGRLQDDIEAAAAAYQKLAKKLGSGRRKAAAALSKAVTERMQELGMAGGRFEVALHALDEDSYSLTGLERPEFTVTANAGQPLRPLAKVASGGELSRISLAIQVVGAQNTRIPSLVFDEVDVGIGGAVAEIVGRLLRELGERRQVLCVTHLPQVAALGHHHLQVSKRSEAANTLTRIQRLTAEERTDEIARMLGGLKITDQTLSHAREMIERAQAG